MPLTLNQLKKMHDKAYDNGYVTRLRASNDYVFFWVTQWDDQLLQDSQLSYRGEFDILRKAGRQISTELEENPVQTDFMPKGATPEEMSELADGLYRTDDFSNTSIQSYENGKMEAIVCGAGAWLLYSEYESLSSEENSNQAIKRKPIFEANNTVFWDPNSKLLDKSDANYVSVLTAYSEDAYLDLVEELTGERPDSINMDSFKQPEHSYSFPWLGGGGKKIYVVEFFHREKVKIQLIDYTDPFGEVGTMRESDIEPVMDEMKGNGFSFEEGKKVTVWQVTKYIASGAEILNGEKKIIDEETGEEQRTGEIIVGQNIPVVPIYGEYAYIEGEPHYEGIVRLAKDPQRLRNFGMSYLADIVSRSPRSKPIYWQDQIAGLENFYQESGADDNYPYKLMHRFDKDGRELPLGPIATTPEQPMPTALATMLGLTREAVEDVASAGLPGEMSDPSTQIAFKTVNALQARIDKQSYVYQKNFKTAKRRDAEVWASMMSEIIDTPRTKTITAKDGTKTQVQIMESVIDNETGEIVTLNDFYGSEFDVYTKIGPAYSSQKEQTIEKLTILVQGMAPGDPIRRALELKILLLMDGSEFDDVQEYAKKELILSGVRQPETDEEKQMFAQAQQGKDTPDAATLLALAEERKAQAMEGKNQIELIKTQANARNEEMKRVIDEFKAVTDRARAQVDAQESDANIEYRRADTMGKELDNVEKVKGLSDLSKLSDDDLFQMMES